MKLVYTNGENPDFVMLCGLLDESLDEIVGKGKRAKYKQYNTLENIHDVILIYDKDIPVASAGFKKFDDKTAEVKRVFVCKDYRGRGISKLLLSALEEKAKSKGYSRLILETGKLLTAAHSLYQSFGFQVIANYGPYANIPESICMQKEL